ncbi:MAG: hypothetical protein ABSF63_11115 [Candidatus Bathyarchaeia archaeon]
MRPHTTTFPATIATGFSLFEGNWFEVGLILNPPPPIPEYPLELHILAILTVIAYGVIRHRNRN